MRAILGALRDRLMIEQRLREARFATVALEAALEEIGAPAMLLVKRRVQHANAAARELLAREPLDDRLDQAYEDSQR